MKSNISPRDPLCARRICVHSKCPILDDLPCRDFSKSPEISGEDFKRACEIEEELLLMAIPGHAHSEFGRGALENKSGLSMRRATIAFDRLNKYGLIERNKNYNNGYHWILTEKGEEKREKLRASGAQRKESAT